MIAQLVAEARVDLVVGQVRERVERLDRWVDRPKPMPPLVLFCAGKIQLKRYSAPSSSVE